MSKPILIGNHIKPKSKPTRTEVIFGVPYVFTDKNKDGHFIAEVSDPTAAELMLRQPAHFYPYPPDQPRLQRAPAANPGDVAAAELAQIEEAARLAAEQEARDKAAAEEAERKAKEAADLASANPPPTPEVLAEANALLEHPVAKIPVEMQKVSSMDVVKLALEIEKNAEKPRAGAIKALTDAVTMAAESPQS